MKNTAVLIDTNVLLNYITGRTDPYSRESSEIVRMCACGDITGYISFHSLPTIWYILRKWDDAERRQSLKDICEIFALATASSRDVIDAIENVEFTDFEDCLQDKCAKDVGADYIITCNISDFSYSEVPAITPEQFIDMMKS